MNELIRNREPLAQVRQKLNATLKPFASWVEFAGTSIPADVGYVHVLDAADVYRVVRDPEGDKISGDGGKWSAARVATADQLDAAVADAAADRVQTGLDRIATAADRVATAADRVATGEDRTATGADRVQTGLDASATASDRVATGVDRTATAEDRVQTGTDAGTATTKAAEAAASAASIQPYPSRAAAIAANVPAPVSRILVTAPNGKSLAYVRAASTTGAALTTNGAAVGWLPDGPVTPEHFGAVGDGITTDTATVRAAVAYGGKQTWDGLYLIDGALTMIDGLHIKGTGTVKSKDGVLQAAGGFYSNLATSAGDWSIEGLTIDGNMANRPSATAGFGVLLKGQSSGPRLKNLKVIGWPGGGIGIAKSGSTATTNAVIEGCSITGTGGVGLSQNGAYGTRIVGNYFRDNALENLTIDMDCQHTYVSGNTFMRHLGGVGNIGAGYGGDHTRIVGNFIDNENDTTVGSEWRNGIQLRGLGIMSAGMVITGNTIINCAHAGVYIRDTTTGGAWTEYGSFVLSGNAFKGNLWDIELQDGNHRVVIGPNAFDTGLKPVSFTQGDLVLPNGMVAFEATQTGSTSFTANGSTPTVVPVDSLVRQKGGVSIASGQIQIPQKGWYSLDVQFRLSVAPATSGATFGIISISTPDGTYRVRRSVKDGTEDLSLSITRYFSAGPISILVTADSTSGTYTGSVTSARIAGVLVA